MMIIFLRMERGQGHRRQLVCPLNVHTYMVRTSEVSREAGLVLNGWMNRSGGITHIDISLYFYH